MVRLVVPLLVLLWSCASAAETARPPANQLIDYEGFARNVGEVWVLREARRVSEADFIRMAGEPDTVVLDARSERLFRLRHVVGAVNLSFPEFTEATLASAIPTHQTRILIYCNNNFQNAPGPFPSKLPSASLNISTYIALYDYGYRNVYELGPLIDIGASRLELESRTVR